MELLNARYVMGHTLDLDGPGAVVQVRGGASELTALAARLGTLGPLSQRTFREHVALGVRCSPDVVEALVDAMETLAADPEASPEEAKRRVEASRRPGWARLVEAARASDLPVLLDDEGVSIGSGAWSATYGLAVGPRSLAGLGRVPLALVTGTNGKTTTTRLIAAMGAAWGLTVGHTSSDGIFVGEGCVERGDWSGPGAARRLLRHGRVEFAVLEAARGGMLRRGVQVDFADVAVVTNVSADHLGEWGVYTVDEMAEVKLLIADGLRQGGTLILNSDGWRWPELLAQFSLRRPDVRVRWFGQHGGSVESAPTGAWVRDDVVVLDGEDVLPVADIPLTFGGRAAHNIENALAAVLTGRAMGVPIPMIAAGLKSLTPDPEHSAGRGNVFTVEVPGGSATVFVDFAHNAEGMRHLAALALSWPASRRLLLAGQAGDRTNELLDGFTRIALEMRPDFVFLKDMPKYLRGRQPYEVVARMERILAEAAVPTSRSPDELSATDVALASLRAGDFLLLLAHTDAAAVVERVQGVGKATGAL